jgi:alkylated DNA repair dioxygenase AlkB
MPRKPATPSASLPDGFLYQPDFLTKAEEASLLRTFQSLPFEVFDFHGYKARRRIVEYGWEYDFGSRQASATQPIPDFLIPVRERAATFAGIGPEKLVEAVVTEYPSGAPIGWHRDVPQFETVLGVSLASSCQMRFKPYRGEGKRVSAILEPRSLYLLRGPARWNFQHSIPAVEQLRYSITFRSLREPKKPERGTAKADTRNSKLSNSGPHH